MVGQDKDSEDFRLISDTCSPLRQIKILQKLKDLRYTWALIVAWAAVAASADRKKRKRGEGR